MPSRSGLILGLGIMALSGYAAISAFFWPLKTALFPIVISIPLFILAAIEVTALWLQGLVSNHRLFPVSIVRVPIYALAVLVLVGLFIFIRRGDWIMTFIIAGSFGLMCLTPWPTQFTRYLEPLAPFLTIAAVLCSSARLVIFGIVSAPFCPTATAECRALPALERE